MPFSWRPSRRPQHADGRIEDGLWVDDKFQGSAKPVQLETPTPNVKPPVVKPPPSTPVQPKVANSNPDSALREAERERIWTEITRLEGQKNLHDQKERTAVTVDVREVFWDDLKCDARRSVVSCSR
jgi:hypothetical protein